MRLYRTLGRLARNLASSSLSSCDDMRMMFSCMMKFRVSRLAFAGCPSMVFCDKMGVIFKFDAKIVHGCR